MTVINPASAVTELRIDASYRNTNDWRHADDVFNRFFRFSDDKAINNTSGFRPKSKRDGSTDIVECAFCVLVTNFGETEWPDSLERESGQLVYYGDNRSPGRRLNDTAIGGNRLLEHVFTLLHSGRRELIPPFLCFESYKTDTGSQMKFLGLACPGAHRASAFEDLVAVWRVAGDARFQNYRAVFTILRTEIIQRDWLVDLVDGVRSFSSAACPESWNEWVHSGVYSPLKCARQVVPRTREEQGPRDSRERRVLQEVFDRLSDREFEFAAADLLEKMDPRFVNLVVTRATRDGGRDVIANYRVGHDNHQVLLSAYVEAKRWNPSNAVGVKPMMRLIARLKHRDLGVFVTTSFFETQVQEELIEDRHPILLLSGGDIARLLISREMDDPVEGGRLSIWIEAIQARARSADAHLT